MEPEHLKFGGGAAQTVLNPAVLVLVLIAGVLMCIWPRNKAIVPFLAASILIPMDQVLLIGSLHFPALRLLIFFGMVRIVREKVSSKRKVFSGGMNKIDVAVILASVFTALAGIALFQESGALIFQLGEIYTVFGVYFLLRFLIRDEKDVVCLVRTLALVSVVIAMVMTYELATGHNPYALLGGARASFYTTLMQRDDRFRATACFDHPILAGTFGAILIPLFVLLWKEGKKNRAIAVVGIVSATLITIASNSSTPILAYAAGVIALCLWPVRKWMRVIRWGIVLTIVSLHLVMKAPVWHLISRIDISGGSSSYHRFMLVDQCIRHFGDWWLVGVKSTTDWGWDMWDTANQYVGVCETSGLLPFILFLATIVYGFKYLGKARKSAGTRNQQMFLWALGAALFANVVAFFGISYFDQTQVIWYGLLAAISAAAVIRPKGASTQVPISSREARDWGTQLEEPVAEIEYDENEPDPRRLPTSHSYFTF